MTSPPPRARQQKRPTRKRSALPLGGLRKWPILPPACGPPSTSHHPPEGQGNFQIAYRSSRIGAELREIGASERACSEARPPAGHRISFWSRADLDVARLGGLDGGIDETLASAHGVEEELLRGEPAQVRVLDKPAGLRAEVVLGEVREGAVDKAKGDALALHVLLPHTGNHLRDVDEGALGARRHHLLHVVRLGKGVLRRGARLVARLVQHLVHAVLKRLLHRAPGLRLQLLLLRLLDQRLHLVLRHLDGVVDDHHGLLVSDGVTDADGEALLQQPVVDQRLRLAHEPAGGIRALLLPDGVHQPARRCAQRLLAQRACQQLATHHQHLHTRQASAPKSHVGAQSRVTAPSHRRRTRNRPSTGKQCSVILYHSCPTEHGRPRVPPSPGDDGKTGACLQRRVQKNIWTVSARPRDT
eukprot:880643-Prorocentrum_minimum.AAC.10